MTLDPLSFGIGIVIGLVMAWVAISNRFVKDRPEREPNTYSKSGDFLIEHNPEKKSSPYTIYNMSGLGDLLIGRSPTCARFCCATRSEAEELCRVLETGNPPQAAK